LHWRELIVVIAVSEVLEALLLVGVEAFVSRVVLVDWDSINDNILQVVHDILLFRD